MKFPAALLGILLAVLCGPPPGGFIADQFG